MKKSDIIIIFVFLLVTFSVELVNLYAFQSVRSSMVVIRIVFNFSMDGKIRLFRHGIFSFFFRKLKNDLFFFSFLPLASSSEASEPESEAAE